MESKRRLQVFFNFPDKPGAVVVDQQDLGLGLVSEPERPLDHVVSVPRRWRVLTCRKEGQSESVSARKRDGGLGGGTKQRERGGGGGR